MREILLVGAYCDTAAKLKALESLLEQAKTLNLPILIFGRYPLPERIQRLCDYWIFDRSNPIIEDHVISHWHRTHGRVISNVFLDYGFAALDQMTKSLGFVDSLNYDIAYWVGYDVDLTEFTKFREASLEQINEKGSHAVGFMFKPTSEGPFRGFGTTTIAFKVNVASVKLRGSLTESIYRWVISYDQNLLAEDVMEAFFKIAEVKYHILDQSLNLPATLTATGIRKHGDVPNEFPKTKSYLSSCFIGKNEDTGDFVCFIWNIKSPNLKIALDFGYGTEVFEVENHAEFSLTQMPIQCKVIAINDEPIDETLDLEYPNTYWRANLLRQDRV
jgi:hypothetical protein